MSLKDTHESTLKKRTQLKRALEAVDPHNRLLPLSPVQAKSWHYQKSDPQSVFYNISLRIPFKGKLNVSVLESSVADLLRIHEALNIRFVETASGPVQFLVSPDQFKMKTVDLRLQSQELRDQTFERLLQDFSSKPLQLDGEPLFEATLIQLSDQENELFIQTHQIVCDGISCFVLLHDLQSLYRSKVEGPHFEAPKFKTSLFDYIEKQLQLSEGPQFESQLHYWKEKLMGAPAHVDFSPNHGEAIKTSPIADYETALLDSNGFAEIKNFCQQHGLTPFMFMLAAFNITLFKTTGQQDLVIGTLINNRSEFDHETWKMIGEFTNFVVLRSKLNPSMSALELVNQLKTVTLEAHSHSTCPFEHVMEALNSDRERRHEAPYQMDSINIDFIMHNMEFAQSMVFGHGLTSYPTRIPPGIGHEVTMVDMGIELQLIGDSLQIGCQYNRGKLSPDSIRDFLENFKENAARVVKNSGERISAL